MHIKTKGPALCDNAGVDEDKARWLAGESVFYVQLIRFLQALLQQQQRYAEAAEAAAWKCDFELSFVESCLQKQQRRDASRHAKGFSKAPCVGVSKSLPVLPPSPSESLAQPDTVYVHLAAAGAAYRELHSLSETLEQLSELLDLLVRHTSAFKEMPKEALDAAASRVQRQRERELREAPLTSKPRNVTLEIRNAAASCGEGRVRFVECLDTLEAEGALPAPQLGGYCLASLVEDGALLPATPKAGEPRRRVAFLKSAL